MSNKAKKHIAFLLLTYIFCVFTAPYLLSALSDKHEVKNELIVTSENQTGNTTSEVRELEEIIDLEEDENISLLGSVDRNSCFKTSFYTSYLIERGEILSFSASSVPIFIRHGNFRI